MEMSAVEQLSNAQPGIMADLLGISEGALSLTPASSITNPPTSPPRWSPHCKGELGKRDQQQNRHISQGTQSTILKSSITNHVMLNSPVQTRTSRNVHSMDGSGPMGTYCSCWYPVLIHTHACTRTYPHSVLYKSLRL